MVYIFFLPFSEHYVNPIRSGGGGGAILPPQTVGRLFSKNQKSQSPKSFCLNLLNFGYRFHVWDRKKYRCSLTSLLFSRSILTIFDLLFYIARDRAPVSTRMIPNVRMRSTKHTINHILFKKFLVKPNWVKVRQSLGGQYCPLGPDVNLKA